MIWLISVIFVDFHKNIKILYQMSECWQFAQVDAYMEFSWKHFLEQPSMILQ